MTPPGIYVEISINRPLDEIWRLTQIPDLHQRWDLRFTRIRYLPRPDPAAPQHFLYETRIGFGLAIRGTGESVATRTAPDGTATSALKFASEDPKSLIREGAGYWRYLPTSPASLRFLTGYSYRVRFDLLGRIIDRLVFRPLMGWATAWSFDRLRLWAETGQTPETSLTLALIHALARLAVAFIWIWHGLVPKLLFRNPDERLMLTQSGLPADLLPWIGAAEILFGLLLLAVWRSRPLLLVSATAMLAATVAVAVNSPAFLTAAFNPVTLNLAVFTLSLLAFLASARIPSASRCLRTPPSTPPFTQEPPQP